MTYTQKERLRMLDCLLVNYGSIGHAMLMDWFGVSSACATRDISLYRDLAPANVYFDSGTKHWHRAASFRPLLGDESQIKRGAAAIMELDRVTPRPLTPEDQARAVVLALPTMMSQPIQPSPDKTA